MYLISKVQVDLTNNNTKLSLVSHSRVILATTII